MVTDINMNVVSIEERLSDHVCLYERKEGVLRIVAWVHRRYRKESWELTSRFSFSDTEGRKERVPEWI